MLPPRALNTRLKSTYYVFIQQNPSEKVAVSYFVSTPNLAFDLLETMGPIASEGGATNVINAFVANRFLLNRHHYDVLLPDIVGLRSGGVLFKCLQMYPRFTCSCFTRFV